MICANRSRKQFVGGFDSFETDPPYTIAGATLFVRRGVELLEHGRGYGMLSFGHTSPPDRVRLQAALTSAGRRDHRTLSRLQPLRGRLDPGLDQRVA